MVILQAAADFDDGRAKTVETQAIEDARQKQFAAKEEPEEEEEEHVKPADGELEFQEEEEEEHVVPPTGATEAATDATSAHSDSDSENDDQAEKPENAEKPEAPIIPQKLPETQPAAAVLSNSQAETMAAFPQTQLDATQEGQEAKKDSEEGKDLEAEKDNPEEEKDRETEAEAKKCLQPQESEGEKVPEAEKDQATGEGEKVPEAEKDQATGPKVVEGVVQPGLKEPVEQAMTPSGEANEKTVQKGQIKLSSFFKSNILDSAHAHMTAPSSSIAPTAPSSVVPPADETPALALDTGERSKRSSSKGHQEGQGGGKDGKGEERQE